LVEAVDFAKEHQAEVHKTSSWWRALFGQGDVSLVKKH
jgi:hypothetical protein